ncbi:aldose 1-epimerase [Sphingomonas sp. F9_3S_D5_B_2]
MNRSLILRAGNLRLDLRPDLGGSIAGLHWMEGGTERPILRQSPEPLDKVLEAASFPLVPYVNRIRGGFFRFRGREVRLAPNMAGDPSPLHGQGWLNAWQIGSADERSAVLTYRHEAAEWPWTYEAAQRFALDRGGLSLRLTCRNASEEPMPCGIGVHPYFPCGPQTRINTNVDAAWTIDAEVLPVDKVPATGRYDLKDRLVCAQDLDNGFGGWGGEAVLSDPDWPYEIAVASPHAKFFQLYSPPAGGICVVEPVTHANAALNAPEAEWPQLGMRVLEPGEEMSLDSRIEVRPARAG